MKGWEETTIRHGTNSGYSLHGRLGERPCDACYRAKQQYDKRWRSISSRTIQSRIAARAQGRAATRLRHMFPDIWAVLYQEELATLKRGYEEGLLKVNVEEDR